MILSRRAQTPLFVTSSLRNLFCFFFSHHVFFSVDEPDDPAAPELPARVQLGPSLAALSGAAGVHLSGDGEHHVLHGENETEDHY